jgi:hypothetical protein
MKNGYLKILTVLICITLLTGCGAGKSETVIKSSEQIRITCEVFFRPSAGTPLEASPELSFEGGNKRQSVDFESLSFEAIFQDDPYEGRALKINISTLDGRKTVVSQLYQFDSQNPPINQFVGGHGFTGLVYVFHPDSAAEMQYFCNLR